MNNTSMNNCNNKGEVVQTMLSVERSYHQRAPSKGASHERTFPHALSSSPHSVCAFVTDNNERNDEPDEFSSMSDESIRDEICSWMFEVADFCSFDREAIYVGMFFYERYMCIRYQNACSSNQVATKRREAQIVALTSLYIAVKLHRKQQRMPLLELFVTICRGKFDAHHIEEMEMNILCALEWKLHPPTPQAIMYQFLKGIHFDRDEKAALQVIHEVANYIVEMALCFLWHEIQENDMKASTIAYTSIAIALKGVRKEFLAQSNVCHFDRNIRDLLLSSDSRQRLDTAMDLITDIVVQDFSDSNPGIEELLSSLDSERRFYGRDASFLQPKVHIMTTPQRSNSPIIQEIVSSTPPLSPSL